MPLPNHNAVCIYDGLEYLDSFDVDVEESQSPIYADVGPEYSSPYKPMCIFFEAEITISLQTQHISHVARTGKHRIRIDDQCSVDVDLDLCNTTPALAPSTSCKSPSQPSRPTAESIRMR